MRPGDTPEDFDEDEDWDEDEDYNSDEGDAAAEFEELEGKQKPSTCCGCPEAMCYAIYLFVFTVCE